MNIERAFIAMYRAFDVLYSEQPGDEAMLNWVSDINPYLRIDRRAIVESEQGEFEEYAAENGYGDDLSPDEGFALVCGFLDGRFDWSPRFDGVSINEWRALCDMVDQEEDDRVVRHVRWTGLRFPQTEVVRALKGKTLKSVEYVPEPPRDDRARLAPILPSSMDTVVWRLALAEDDCRRRGTSPCVGKGRCGR